jgi:cytochrome c biogenesis protein CcmG/thiol:disulfide interchange protein DsbE
MNKSRIAGLAVSAVFAALFCGNLVAVVRGCEGLRPVTVGDPAPEVALPRIDGGTPARLSSLRGKVVLIDFWATWCGPCRQTMPMLESLYRKKRAAGLEVMSIDTEGMPAAGRALAFARRLDPPVTFPLYADDGHAAAAYRVGPIPHLALIDKQGRIRRVYVGVPQADLEDKVEALLRE